MASSKRRSASEDSAGLLSDLGDAISRFNSGAGSDALSASVDLGFVTLEEAAEDVGFAGAVDFELLEDAFDAAFESSFLEAVACSFSSVELLAFSGEPPLRIGSTRSSSADRAEVVAPAATRIVKATDLILTKDLI